MKPKEAYGITIFTGCVLLVYLSSKGWINLQHLNILHVIGGLFVAGLVAMSVAKMAR